MPKKFIIVEYDDYSNYKYPSTEERVVCDLLDVTWNSIVIDTICKDRTALDNYQNIFRLAESLKNLDINVIQKGSHLTPMAFGSDMTFLDRDEAFESIENVYLDYESDVYLVLVHHGKDTGPMHDAYELSKLNKMKFDAAVLHYDTSLAKLIHFIGV